MASRFHKSKLKRKELSAVVEGGTINLVPLVDILTSIVFFSLLTYSGATVAALTSFDLSLPPVVITAEEAERTRTNKELINLLLAVRINNDSIVINHSEQGGFRRLIPGMNAGALNQLQMVLTEIKQQYPQNSDVLVIPSDDVNYDNIIQVLERAKLARYTGISLGTRTRVAQAQSGGA